MRYIVNTLPIVVEIGEDIDSNFKMTEINHWDMTTNNNFEDSPSQGDIDDIKKECENLT